MSSSTRYRRQVKVPSTDGRSADARLMRRTREALLAHVGKAPTATQKALIDRGCWLTLYVDRLDRKAIENGGVHAEQAGRQYLAYSNSLSRTLWQIGLKEEPAEPETLAG